ncbi:MAG: DNA mismatch repair protein MutS [FCB group bacterium]|nr:DNA mismatch repair protein MutS [FCB group bacterium]
MARTPMMEQYNAIKAQYNNAVLFFRMGDFFEMFNEDAKTASQVLGLTLTSRNQGQGDRTPLAGFPHHQLESYLAKMIKAGFRVAVCEQVEDPKKAKGLVKREVIEVVTSGSSLSERSLEHDSNNYIAAFVENRDGSAGAALADVSTGEFFVLEGSFKETAEELRVYSPAELLFSEDSQDLPARLKLNSHTMLSGLDGWIFSKDYTEETLKKHFDVVSLRGLGLDNTPEAVIAAGALLHYLREELKRDCSHIKRISLQPSGSGMLLDAATIRNLELFTSFSGRQEAALYHTVNRTLTSMGARLLRRWIARPLLNAEKIRVRLQIVDTLFRERNLRYSLTEPLKSICDIERTTARLTAGRGNARDALGLLRALKQIPIIVNIIAESGFAVLQTLAQYLNPAEELTQRLESALAEDPPLSLTEGGIFREGYNERLDKLRKISGSGKEWIVQQQESERARTGIPSLKIGYNKVFGYYIEITQTHKNKIPQDYIRKQTLVNSERYITPELKEYEEQVLKAEEEIKELEYELFNELRYTIGGFADVLQKNAEIIARIDILRGFAETAETNGYNCPVIDEGDVIELTESRHPVIERLLPPGERFIPNDLMIGGDIRIMLITGPNMAGKSTYLRQTALITLMAQIGCFVPAAKAHIGIVDRIFTRVGAQDNLVEGESTFLLEMNEAAMFYQQFGFIPLPDNQLQLFLPLATIRQAFHSDWGQSLISD